jgi:hypothetical protein
MLAICGETDDVGTSTLSTKVRVYRVW